MKVVGIVSLVLVGLGIVALVAGLAVLSYLSRATSYCPWRHELSDLASCSVLDETADRALIQHAELDIDVYYLELLHDGVSRYYAMPESVTQLAPEGYTAKLIPGNDGTILFNGTEFPLVRLEHAPSW